jgi:hypothetical protein
MEPMKLAHATLHRLGFKYGAHVTNIVEEANTTDPTRIHGTVIGWTNGRVHVRYSDGSENAEFAATLRLWIDDALASHRVVVEHGNGEIVDHGTYANAALAHAASLVLLGALTDMRAMVFVNAA